MLYISAARSKIGIPIAVRTGAVTPVGVAKYFFSGKLNKPNQMGLFSRGLSPHVPAGKTSRTIFFNGCTTLSKILDGVSLRTLVDPKLKRSSHNESRPE